MQGGSEQQMGLRGGKNLVSQIGTPHMWFPHHGDTIQLFLLCFGFVMGVYAAVLSAYS